MSSYATTLFVRRTDARSDAGQLWGWRSHRVATNPNLARTLQNPSWSSNEDRGPPRFNLQRHHTALPFIGLTWSLLLGVSEPGECPTNYLCRRMWGPRARSGKTKHYEARWRSTGQGSMGIAPSSSADHLMAQEAVTIPPPRRHLRSCVGWGALRWPGAWRAELSVVFTKSSTLEPLNGRRVSRLSCRERPSARPNAMARTKEVASRQGTMHAVICSSYPRISVSLIPKSHLILTSGVEIRNPTDWRHSAAQR